MLGTPITSGLGGSGRHVNGSMYADLPSPVGAAYFVSGVTPGQLSRARGTTTGYTVVCPHGEWEGDEITSGLGGSGRHVNGSMYADLPSPVGAAYFVSGVTPGQLSRARGTTTGYTVVCPHGEWEGDEITLRDCTFSSPQEAARVEQERERTAARERAEQERAQAQEAQVEQLLANGARFPAADMSGISSEGNTAYVMGGLPDRVSRANFASGISSSLLLDARRRQETVVCPRGESNGADWVTLHDCTFAR